MCVQPFPKYLAPTVQAFRGLPVEAASYSSILKYASVTEKGCGLKGDHSVAAAAA